MYKYILDTDTYVFLSMQCLLLDYKNGPQYIMKNNNSTRPRVVYHTVKMDSKYIYWCADPYTHTHIVRVWSAAVALYTNV